MFEFRPARSGSRRARPACQLWIQPLRQDPRAALLLHAVLRLVGHCVGDISKTGLLSRSILDTRPVVHQASMASLHFWTVPPRTALSLGVV